MLSISPTPTEVDLNADLGEEITDDAALLQVVTSANVACGGHAGTPETMRLCCAQAARLDVSVGAQVSYVDRANFGRVALDVHHRVLQDQIAEQVGVLSAIAEAEGTRVRYVKPHGALYHRVIDDSGQAAGVLVGSGTLPVLGFRGGFLMDFAKVASRTTFIEGFPDRGYGSDGRLVPRDQPGALLTDAQEIADQAVSLAPTVDSLCVHGDSPGAVARAHAVRRAIEGAGYRLAAFV